MRIVYHAAPDDQQTVLNEEHVADWVWTRSEPRVTSRICHDKFIVLSRVDNERRTPAAVLCGSTNFTHNGVYRQANVVHTANRPELAQTYLRLFEVLFSGKTPGETKKWINEYNPLSSDAGIVAGFSPRGGEVDLDLFAAEIRGAGRDVLFCTAFDLNARILEALKGKPHDSILRFGLQNSTDTITGIHRDRTADFVATAMLNEGLEGFLKESAAGQKGNILIHTKLVVVDFTSDAPTVISGSHNLSAAASGGNDENFLIIRGAVDVADCYGVELMRLYDHYRFRWHQSPRSHKRGPAAPARGPRVAGMARCAPDDRWAKPYFEDGTLEAPTARASPCRPSERATGRAGGGRRSHRWGASGASSGCRRRSARRCRSASRRRP